MNLTDMLAMLRDRKPEPGESGAQRISWAFGQVALSYPASEHEKFRVLAEQAVCAKYEERIAALESALSRLHACCVSSADTASCIDAMADAERVLKGGV